MNALLSALLLLQQGTAPAAPAKPDSEAIRQARRDSTHAVEARRDSVHRQRERAKRDVVITPQMLASAYLNADARTLIARARGERLTQDSTLRYYDAISRQRLSAGLSIRQSGADRMLLRTENASRVQWQRGRGALVTVMGARTAFPMLFKGVRVSADFLELDPVPYFPGREGLIQFADSKLATKSDEGLYIHPLDRGAEAYYTFRAMDSIVYRLPDGSTIHLRAVDVRARKPAADLIVGTLWFDEATGQLVRGVFRPALPLDIKKLAEEEDSTAFEDVPRLVKPVIFPMELSVASFTVEYGLHEQRWWLPRVETVEGRARIGFMYASFSSERSFTYTNVNGVDTIPRIFASREDSLRHLPGDSLYKAARTAERDSANAERMLAKSDTAHAKGVRVGRGRRRNNDDDEEIESFHCSGKDTTITRRMRYDGALPIQIVVPCDTAALLRSPELPPTIYSNGDKMFGIEERDALVKELTMSLQPGWGPQPVQWHYGLENSLIRYNRVEAIDAGVQVSRVFGEGYSGDLTARVATDQFRMYGEAHMQRSDGMRTYDLGLYSRLAYANDWGDPLTFRASLNAMILGTDLGFYYNAWGAELTSKTPTENGFTWRLFAEQQSNAPVTTNFSIPNLINGKQFTYNVVTPMTNAAGAAVRYRGDVGLDPHGWRESYDARAEGAVGRSADSSFAYGRFAFDGTISHGVGKYLDAQLGAGAGSSVGDLTPQRDYFLGGSWTIRGQPPGIASGDAYWLGHFEIGSSFVAVRPTLFFDMGWAGSRTDWRNIGKPVSGAGIGVSFMDGLIRMDIAKAVQPTAGWTLDFTTGTRF